MRISSPPRANFAAAAGLLSESHARFMHWAVPLLEAAMKNITRSANEFICGLSFMFLGSVTASLVEPHLGSLVVLPSEVRWKFHFIAGACAAIGFVQTMAVIRDRAIIRLWMARCAAPLCAMLAWLFAHIAFRGISAWAGALFIANALAVHYGETRESAESRLAP